MNARPRDHARPRHEVRDLNVRAVVLAALGILATVLLVAAIGYFLTGVAGPARSGPTETSSERPKWLLSDPEEPRATFEREKRTRLNSYGWVDRDRQIAHVPIERAMEMQAAGDAGRRSP